MSADDKEVSQKSSYSLLQRKMNEIEKSKKSSEQRLSKNSQNSSTSSNKSSYSPKTTPKPIEKKSSPKEKESESDKKKKIADPNVPDRSYGDYFCSICDSHMNSDGMWEAHITGKRHLKNVKKGDPDPKYEDLDIESNVKYEIRNVKDPIIGLSYIHEIRRKEPGAPPLYTCFLCQATFATVPMVVEHVISMKHRLNYMKENSPDEYQLLGATNLKKGHMEPLVHEVALKLENKFGRGTVKVKQERIKYPLGFPSKRGYDSDDGDVPRKIPKNSKYEEKKSNPYVWKAVEYDNRESSRNVNSSRENIRITRSYSSDEEDRYRHHEYIKQPSYDNRHSSKYESTPPRDAFIPEHYPHSRSYETQEKIPQNADNYPRPSESTSKTDSSQVLKDFVQKIHALPSDIFLKIALYKLENMEVKGIEELTLLSRLINRAQVVICNKLPPEVQVVLKQRMSQNSDSNVQKSSAAPLPQVPPSVAPRVAESTSFNAPMNYQLPSSQLPGSSLSFIKDILNGANIKSNQNTVPHQSPVAYPEGSYASSSYPNTSLSSNANYSSSSGTYSSNANYSQSSINYTHNNVPSSSTSSIPGLTLTEENRDVQSSYSNYQSHQPRYSDPPPSYPPYRY